MQTRFSKVILYAVLVAWSLVCIFPLYWIAVTSFKGIDIIDKAPTYIPFGDFAPSLEAWQFILGDPANNLVARVFNSVVIGLIATALTIFSGAMLVYGLTRFISKSSSSHVLAAILATRILPPAVVAVPLYFMAQQTATLDTMGVLVFVYTAINLPIAVWMLIPVFGSRATDQEEAAALDGASHFHICFFILMPMMKSAIITVGLLVFLQCWNEYLLASFLTSDHAITMPPWMVGQISLKEAQTGGGAEEVAHLSAAIVVMALPVLLFTIFIQASLTRVITGSARSRTS